MNPLPGSRCLGSYSGKKGCTPSLLNLSRRKRIRREQPTAVQRAREPSSLAVAGFEEISRRRSEAFEAVPRRAIEIFDNRERTSGLDVDDWLQAESEVLHPVHLVVDETEGALTVRAVVPGFESNDVTINVESRRLAVSGKIEINKEQRTAKTIYPAQYSDEILHSVELPAEVDASQTTSTLKNGRLELHMPIVSRRGPTHIQVKARQSL